MMETEIELPVGAELADLSSLIEECCAELELHVAMRASLKSYPESTHWHLRKPGQRGTLEVTLWPPKRRLWLSIQSGRAAEWTAPAAAELQLALEARLRPTHAPASTE